MCPPPTLGRHALTRLLIQNVSIHIFTSLSPTHTRTHTCVPTNDMNTLYLKAVLCVFRQSMSLQYMTSRGQAPPRPNLDSECLSSIAPSPPLSLSLSQWVFLMSFYVRLLHSSLHSVDTFTTFWWVRSPSGVVTGGVGMLIMAVVIWLLWQFREAGSSTRMFRLERLQEDEKERLGIVSLCWNPLVHVRDK